MGIDMNYIQAQLQRRAGERQLRIVARAVGLHWRTIYRLAHGQSGTMKNAQKVQDFLRENERVKKLDKESA